MNAPTLLKMNTARTLRKRCISLIIGGVALWLSAGAVAAPTTNGINLNGLGLNGIMLNGLTLNGIMLNGITLNRLSFNGLTLNRLSFNGLTRNRLSFNGLAQNRLSFNGLVRNGIMLNGIRANALSDRDAQTNRVTLNTLVQSASGRELLKYIVGCALKEGDQLAVQQEGETYSYSGSMGLAPEWRDVPLSASGQRWVTACLLARTNFFGVSVPISMRGSHPALNTSPEEEAEYRTEEGAFYGNLFAKEPVSASCVGTHDGDTTVSPDLTKRVCATDAVDGKTACGFIAAGQCQKVCNVETNDQGLQYTDCRSGVYRPGSTAEVITVYLRHSE